MLNSYGRTNSLLGVATLLLALAAEVGFRHATQVVGQTSSAADLNQFTLLTQAPKFTVANWLIAVSILSAGLVGLAKLFTPRLMLPAFVAICCCVLITASRVDGNVRESARPAFSHTGQEVLVTVLTRPGIVSSPFGQQIVADVSLNGVRMAATLPQNGADWNIGEILKAKGTISLIEGDAFSALSSQGKMCRLKIREAFKVSERQGGLGLIDSLRKKAMVALATDQNSTQKSDRDALLQGMVLGDDSRFSEAQRENFRRSGLTHIVAASGQNIALVVAVVFAFGIALGAKRETRIYVAALSVAIYVPLAGSGPSIRRAGVMGMLGLWALRKGTLHDGWRALLWAAVITLLVDPLAYRQLGWQLSFASVIGLLWLTPPVTALLIKRGFNQVLAVAVAIPVAAAITSSPIIAATFGTFSVTSLPANLLVEPLVGFVTLAGMVVACIGQLEPIFTWVGTFSDLLVWVTQPALDLINWTARTAAAPEWAVLQTSVTLLLLPLVGVALLSCHRSPALTALAKQHGFRKMLVVCFLFAAGLLLHSWFKTGRTLTDGIYVVDVGQGSATLLVDQGSSALIDTGTPDGEVVKKLKRLGLRELNILVLSHQQHDHVGAAKDVIKTFKPKLVVGALPADAVNDANRSNAQVTAATAGQQLTAGNLKLHVLWPTRSYAQTVKRSFGHEDDPNNGAIVIATEIGGITALVPADREGHQLNEVIKQQFDVLILPHHGSSDPAVPELLRRVAPKVAIAQVGRRNRYGHPAAETIDAVQLAKIKLLRTDHDGTIFIPRAATLNVGE